MGIPAIEAHGACASNASDHGHQAPEEFIDLDDIGEFHGQRPLAGEAILPADSSWPTPPDGLCLAYCVLAAQDPQRWMNTARHGIGFARDGADERRESEAAKSIRAAVVEALRNNGQGARAAQIERGAFPGVGEIQYYADVLQGSIELEPLDYSQFEPRRTADKQNS